MAPEYPPKLVVLDLRFKKGKLIGTLEYIEVAIIAERLRVRWAVESKPTGFIKVGRGVAYVYKTDKVITIPISKDAEPESLGNSRYRLQEGLRPGDPWLMIILILPKGYTLVDPEPVPVNSKDFKGRLALYWVLKGDEFGRTKADWGIRQFESNLSSEVERINRNYIFGTLPPEANIDIDKTIANPNFENIRTLLTKGFTDEELRRLCYDNHIFRSVYNQLAQNTGKEEIIDLLVEYADQKMQIENLLSLAKNHNPARYEKHQPYYITRLTP